MAGFNIEFSMTDNTGQIKGLLEQAVERALEAVGLMGETYVKALCPTDTSRLKNSIEHITKGDTVYIGTNVEYAPYIEYGTGQYAETGATQGFWVYVKGSNGGGEHSGKRYTAAEALRVVAILRSKGLDAHMTNGHRPVHMIKNGIQNHVKEYKSIIENYLKNA